MKKISTLILLLAVLLSKAQATATDFTANDCTGTSHQLFTELDAGKVVVLIWVMPCSMCINGALAAQAEVQNALASNPGKVLFYLVDDYANTSCQSLSNWCSANGITMATLFSNNAIKMSDYGADGMPKVVVMGGPNHSVFYNQNAPSITANGIKNGIDAAIAATVGNPTGILKNGNGDQQFKLYPHPSNGYSLLEFNLAKNSEVRVSILNQLGQKIADVHSGHLDAGRQTLKINTTGLASGSYFIQLETDGESMKEQLIISH